eukprot:TRINITY_DN474_c0_g1_i5.p1 TRINITY_DN474_c0_g1~~TRINITY_DN474_c0_g1_i5.p1  ORF type:complete len:407 (-),score=60.58 TRINITY_DN474_c0_g1_i5:834-2054(-)
MSSPAPTSLSSASPGNPLVYFIFYCVIVSLGFFISCFFDVFFLLKFMKRCCVSRKCVCPPCSCSPTFIWSWLINKDDKEGCCCIKGVLRTGSHPEQRLVCLRFGSIINEVPDPNAEENEPPATNAEEKEAPASNAEENIPPATNAEENEALGEDMYVTVSDSVAIIVQPWKNIRNICLGMLCMVGIFVHLDELELVKRGENSWKSLLLSCLEMGAYFMLLAVPCFPGGIIARLNNSRNGSNYRPQCWMDKFHSGGTGLGLALLLGTNSYFVHGMYKLFANSDQPQEGWLYTFLSGLILQFFFTSSFLLFNSKLPKIPGEEDPDCPCRLCSILRNLKGGFNACFKCVCKAQPPVQAEENSNVNIQGCHAFWVMLSEVLAVYLVIFFDLLGSVCRNPSYPHVKCYEHY